MTSFFVLTMNGLGMSSHSSGFHTTAGFSSLVWKALLVLAGLLVPVRIPRLPSSSLMACGIPRACWSSTSVRPSGRAPVAGVFFLSRPVFSAGRVALRAGLLTSGFDRTRAGEVATMGTVECGRDLGASEGAVARRAVGFGFWAIARSLKGSSLVRRPPEPLRERVGDGSTGISSSSRSAFQSSLVGDGGTSPSHLFAASLAAAKMFLLGCLSRRGESERLLTASEAGAGEGSPI